MDAYTTVPWATLCELVQPIRIMRLEGKVLQLGVPNPPAYAVTSLVDYYGYQFPIYSASIQPQLPARASAGLVQIDPNRSSAIISLTSGSDTHSAPTQASGELVAEAYGCDTGTSQPCTFTVSYASLQFSNFTIAGKQVSGIVLRNDTNGVGSIVGGVATIPAGSMPLTGQMTIEGEGLSTSSFTNPQPISAIFDPANNSFQMSLSVQSTDGSGETVVVNGTVAGVFRNRSPVAVPSADQVVECATPTGTTANLDASGSFDPDGHITAFEWRGPDLTDLDPAFSTQPKVTTPPMQVGTHEFLLSVKDDFGYSAAATTSVQVADTQGPTITASVSPDCIWPPDHRLIQLNLGTDISASSTDQCCGDVSSSVHIVSVKSSEADNAVGSGNTQPDYTFDPTHVCVRAERSGANDGRTYTITLAAEDCHGNKATKDVTVMVPHDASDHQTCSSPTQLPDCALEAGATPSSSDDSTSQVRPIDSSPPTAAMHAGCSMGGARDAHRATWLVVLLLFVSLRRKAIRRSLALSSLALFGLAGCSSSAAKHGSSDLTIQIANRPPLTLAGDPLGFVQGQACSIQVMTDGGTAFISGTVSMFVPGGTAQIGPGTDQVALWAKTSDGVGPLSASSGTVVVNQFDSSASGAYSLTIQNATKPEDTSGPSLVVNGVVAAKWATPN